MTEYLTIKIFILLVEIIVISLMCVYYFNINWQEEKYTAIIVEPRKHPALEFVLENFTSNLNNKWNFIIFHGNLNRNYIEDIIRTKLRDHINRITLVDLEVDNLTVKEYSELFYEPDFYKNIPTEIFLVFQTDTVICSKHRELIYEFINYDYVGAPIATKIDKEGNIVWLDGPTSKNGDAAVGNGGLSLRKKSKMLEIIEKCPITYNEQTYLEDLYFSLPCPSVEKFKKPDIDESKNFSIENNLNDKTFGVHKPWRFIDVNKHLGEWCPEAVKLKELQQYTIAL